jgi:hypothetical protein
LSAKAARKRALRRDPKGGHSLSLTEGKLDEALTDFEQARAVKEALHNEKGIGETRADIALVHIRRGNSREAVKLLRNSVTILENSDSLTFAIRV